MSFLTDICGQGCFVRFLFDSAKPVDFIDHNWSEFSYDGEPDSWVPYCGPHWHATEDNWIDCLKGRFQYMIDGKSFVLKAGDEPLFVPKYTTHSFSFFKGEAAVIKERSNPASCCKQEFFEDIFWIYPSMDDMSFLQILRVFYDNDVFVALPGGFKILDRLFMATAGYLSTWVVQSKKVALDHEGRHVHKSA